MDNSEKLILLNGLLEKLLILYSDNKVQKVDQKTAMTISWGTDEDNLIHANAEDVPMSAPDKD
jgi:hypothetical protein